MIGTPCRKQKQLRLTSSNTKMGRERFTTGFFGSRRPQNSESTQKTSYLTYIGASPPFSVFAHNSSDQEYPNRRMGRAGIISQPLGLQDWTPCDSILQKCLKDIVQRESPSTVSEIKIKSAQTSASIDDETLKNVSKTWKMVYALH